ncbi:Acetyltransferase (GNAT) domain-containing protein [Dyadobacter soli]|uniref:Acetyltransferase (GNAT) domain-containing protein n=2 Tax=Dyadobacter soli TaxID=659014 RepID=A0A1G7HVV8_9BACT|nr:Acetyltransferase (GNAT) domain-containing protein [Dyadobacter soli]
MQKAPFPTTVEWLFFRKEQLAIQTSDLIYSFILTSKESGDILAVFHCLPDTHGWVSPACAPFGGIMPAGKCDVTQLTFLLTCVREWITDHGGKMLTIKTAPSCYAPLIHELCHRSYLAAGFLPNHTYSNHYIPIADQAFERIIEPAERRRLAKGKKSGLSVAIKPSIYDKPTEDLLHCCYTAQGYTLPVPRGKMVHIINALPDHYLSFTTLLGNRPVATALMVHVSDTVLYHFLSGFLPEFRSLSPSLLLFEAAYELGRASRIQILDLGISLDHHGNQKPTLAGFKKRIGGIECPKIIYRARF